MHILFETNTYVLINKPSGISVHPSEKEAKERLLTNGTISEYTISDWVLEKYPYTHRVGEPLVVEFEGKEINIERPGIVHRLDKDTSGVLLIAKDQNTFLHFKKQFQEHSIEKTYHAFVYGSVKEDVQVIQKPIGRSKNDIRSWAVGSQARGQMRDAYTHVRVLQRIGVIDNKASTEKGTYTFIECKPKTGRTHQIRVHLKSINHPLVCDRLYSKNRIESDPKDNLGFTRLALHARSLAFMDEEGVHHEVIASHPEDFEMAMSQSSFS